MSVIAGLVRFGAKASGDANQVDSAGLRRGIERKATGTAIRRATGAAFYVGTRTRPPPAAQKGTIFAAIARLDNRAELRRLLGASAGLADDILLQHLFERRGLDGIAQAVGAFAFAHWDGSRLTLGRDCVNGCPLFFHRTRDSVIFASDLATLLCDPEVPHELDEEMLAHTLVINWFSPAGSLYREIDRVPARHVAIIEAGDLRLEEYWAPNLTAPSHLRNFGDFVERGRELLDLAVKSAIEPLDSPCISLSGGLDSSAIAATAARLFPQRRFACYTMVPLSEPTSFDPAKSYWDEASKVRSLAQRYPNLDLHFINPSTRATPESDYLEYFLQDPSTGGRTAWDWGAQLIRQSIADGHRVNILGGWGNWGLSWGGDYALLVLLKELRFGKFLQELFAHARESHCSVARTFVKQVLLLGGPKMLRQILLRLNGKDPNSVAHTGFLNPAFVGDRQLSRKWCEQGYDQWYHFGTWRPAALRARRLFDGRMPASFNQNWLNPRPYDELVMPLADRRLLEFCLQVPEYYYAQNGKARSYARAVLADRLPADIANEPRIGLQAFDAFQRLTKEQVSIREEIARMGTSPTAQRVLDIPRLKRLCDEWPEVEPQDSVRASEYRNLLPRALDMARFIRFAERRNN